MSLAKNLKVALPSRQFYAYDAILADAPMRLVVGDGIIRAMNVDIEVVAHEAPITVPPESGEFLAAHVREAAVPRPARVPRAA